MKSILFYGDSNTWGFDPETRDRYPYEKRWTTICAEALRSSCVCIPAGMNGRTTVFDDPLKGCRNGADGLDYELQTHKPLDLLVIMLGTNDLKYADAEKSADGMDVLLKKALSANERFCLSSPVFPEGAKLLLISPILARRAIDDCHACDARKESEKLAGLYRNLAESYGIYFMDASLFAEPSETDGVHLDPGGHEILGQTVAERIRQIMFPSVD